VPSGEQTQWSGFCANGDDGWNLVAALIADNEGDLYDTTFGGGLKDEGISIRAAKSTEDRALFLNLRRLRLMPPSPPFF
jgi:hypothetical protein